MLSKQAIIISFIISIISQVAHTFFPGVLDSVGPYVNDIFGGVGMATTTHLLVTPSVSKAVNKQATK